MYIYLYLSHTINKVVVIFKGITHIISAIIFYRLIFGDVSISAFIILGALFPDIDNKHSILGRYNIFSFMMDHRGFFHTPIGMLLVALPLLSFEPLYFFHFIFGYFVHLLEDSFNKLGIMWLYPYKSKHYSINYLL